MHNISRLKLPEICQIGSFLTICTARLLMPRVAQLVSFITLTCCVASCRDLIYFTTLKCSYVRADEDKRIALELQKEEEQRQRRAADAA